jgi:hypothetical protein
MKSAALYGAVLLVAAASTAAQKPSAVSSVRGSPNLEHTASRCPIAMKAGQGGGLRIERAQDGGSQPFTMPNLTLTNPQGKRIISASVTARGYGANKGTTLIQNGSAQGGGQSVLRSDPNPQRPLLSRTVTVKFQPDVDDTVTGEFLLSGFVVLELIQLDSVTLADGSAWNFAPSSGCSVQPSPLMLISGK